MERTRSLTETAMAPWPDRPLPGAGLYLHIPFCSAICPYCDFAVQVGSARRRQVFVDLLEREITLHSAAPFVFGTLYFGGGTPSLLEPEDLERLLAATRRELTVDPKVRLSMEANPEDVNARSLAEWRRLGISTLSLGVQAFDRRALDLLGRRHSPESARQSIRDSLAAGFATVSLDLIFGFPGQTAAHWRQTLEQAAALQPQHISCYQLEIHPRTVFGKRQARGELREIPEGRQAELFHLAHEVLAAAGYEAYEVSNFARSSEHHSRHNEKYWRHAPYLGLGPGAHSFAANRRWWNERSLRRWELALTEHRRPEAGRELLDAEQLALERLMLGLRTRRGVDLEAFRERYGFDLEAHNRQRIASLRQAGLLTAEAGTLQPTAAGLAVADGLAAGFELRP